MNYLCLFIVALALAACAPQVPSHLPEGTAPRVPPWLLHYCSNPANQSQQQCIDIRGDA